jgi:hypothetical protein
MQEKVNLQFSICDWSEFNSGGSNKAFNFKVPLSKLNGYILKNPDIPGELNQVTAKGSMFVNGMFVLRGKVNVIESSNDMVEITLDGNDWTEDIAKNKLSDLDFSSENFVISEAVIEATWSGADKFCRYPMVNFGSIARGGISSSAQFDPIDFGPWFRVKSILTKIFPKYTIISALFDTTYGKELYVSGKRKLANTNFLDKKAFNAYITNTSDNEDEVLIPASEGGGAHLDCDTYANRIQINSETSDEGDNFANDEYTVPETGTYRFRISFNVMCTWLITQWPLISGTISLKIVRRRAGVDLVIASYQDLAATDTTDWNKIYELDTYYLHFLEDDIIWCGCDLTAADTNGSAGDEYLTLNLQGGALNKFYNIVNTWCMFDSISKTVIISDNMPDMTQLDFLRGLKHAFNLRFWFDYLNGKLYIDPADTFYTTAEYDLTPQIIGNPVSKNFAINYCKKMWLQWRHDSGDKLHVDHLAENNTPPNYKEIVFTNAYMKDDIEVSENPVFSTCVERHFKVLSSTLSIISIYDKFDESVNEYPLTPLKSFLPRLGAWEGLTAGLSWYYDDVLKTTYPKMSTLDYSTLYTSYFLTTLHYINTGKMIECYIKPPPQFINSLISETGSVAALGWKVKYKLNIKGIPYYFILSRVVTDGDTAKLELILRQ